MSKIETNKNELYRIGKHGVKAIEEELDFGVVIIKKKSKIRIPFYKIKLIK